MCEMEKRIDEFIAKCCDEIAISYASELYFIGRKIKSQSPIEQLFAVAFHHLQNISEIDGDYELCQQYQVATNEAEYKIDFVIRGGVDELYLATEKTSFPLIGIELDGHNWHEKTKRQVEHDKIRERALTASGVTLLRYAGTEVWRDPIKCVKDAYSIRETKLSESIKLFHSLNATT